jgi:Protein of unknown function (DUF2786)
MKARYASTVSCGHHVSTGDLIIKVAPKQWVCGNCALSTAKERGRFAERLLEDPKIRALLCKALATESEPEAEAALAAARRLHKKDSAA